MIASKLISAENVVSVLPPSAVLDPRVLRVLGEPLAGAHRHDAERQHRVLVVPADGDDPFRLFSIVVDELVLDGHREGGGGVAARSPTPCRPSRPPSGWCRGTRAGSPRPSASCWPSRTRPRSRTWAAPVGACTPTLAGARHPGQVPVVVPAGHPWAGRPDTHTVPDPRAVAVAAVRALVAAAGEVVEVGRTLARVGRTALWAEVADGLGLPLLHQPELPRRPRRGRPATHQPSRCRACHARKRPDLFASTAAVPGPQGRVLPELPVPAGPRSPIPPRSTSATGPTASASPRTSPATAPPARCAHLADCEERQRFQG